MASHQFSLDVNAWRDEEELRQATQKGYKGGTGSSLSVIYESDSECSTTDASDSSGEEEHYNRKKKKSKLKLSTSSSGGSQELIVSPTEAEREDTDSSTR